MNSVAVRIPEGPRFTGRDAWRNQRTSLNQQGTFGRLTYKIDLTDRILEICADAAIVGSAGDLRLLGPAHDDGTPGVAHTIFASGRWRSCQEFVQMPPDGWVLSKEGGRERYIAEITATRSDEPRPDARPDWLGSEAK